MKMDIQTPCVKENEVVEIQDNITKLIAKGVKIPNPSSVEVGKEVDVDRISGKGVTLHSGVRIYGAKTLICSGARLGYELPATVVNCQIGPETELRGGFFKDSTFLGKTEMASGAHVRECCLLEEGSRGGHTAGLKQTILFPFVTLGSLINFCDCLMAGGTGRKDHSEAGSSYIHFNYTPNQDKATASLIGDVPRGVMINQPPIFLGGQGGLVGPLRIGYGTVIAAGTVYREDCPEGGRLLTAPLSDRENLSLKGETSSSCPPLKRGFSDAGEFETGFYRDVKGRVYNNICYLANLLALRQWYIHVRQLFFQVDEFGPELYDGAMERLKLAVKERLKRFHDLSGKMEKSIKIGERRLSGTDWKTLYMQKRELLENWQELEECFAGGYEEEVEQGKRDPFIDIIREELEKGSSDYIKTIQGLDPETSSGGTAWLQAIVDQVTSNALDVIPSYKRNLEP